MNKEIKLKIKGIKGDTPTDEQLVELIKPLIPEPLKGEDGDTPTDEKLVSLITPLIPEPKNGETPSDEKLIGLIKPLIPEQMEETPNTLVNKVNKSDLKIEKDRLNVDWEEYKNKETTIEDVKDLPETISRLRHSVAGYSQVAGGGTAQNLQQVTDIGATTTNAVSILNTLKVKQATTNAVIIGDVTGNARGNGALDLQSSRSSVTKVASGISSVAVGINNTSSGANSFTSGYNNTASSNYCVASGYSNTASGYNSTALGVSNYVAGNYSSSLGYANNTSQYFSNAVGIANTASGYQSAAFGYSNTALGNTSSAFGNSNTASGNYTSAFGFINNATGNYSVALGAFAQATASSSLAIGSGTASGYYSSDLRTKATGINSVSVGTNSGYYGNANTASGNYSSAFGIANTAFGNNSTAVGYNNTTSGDTSSAFGTGNTILGIGSFASGKNNVTSQNNAFVFGSSVNNSTATTVEIGTSDAGKIQLSLTYLRPFTDNQKTLGGITNRWTTIYGSGGLMLGYTAKTANYTLTATDYLVNCTANTFTITLPTALAITGQIFIIKNSGTGIITLATTSSQTIDGVASGIFTLVQWDSITVTSNGANWIITN